MTPERKAGIVRTMNADSSQLPFDFQASATSGDSAADRPNGALRLERPIVFLDTETTGIDLMQDRVVEIALVRLDPSGARTEFRSLVNPEMEIPEEARRVHGISNEMVAGEPTFAELAPKLLDMLRDVDLGGYNVIRFDVPMLRNEFDRVGAPWKTEGMRIVDAQTIYHRMEPRDLSAAVRYYCGREMEGAHGALADTRATVDVLLGQLERYPALPRDVNGLDAQFNAPDRRFVDSGRKFRWRNGEPYFNFGTHRGASLREVKEKDPKYLDWIGRGEFTPEVKKLVRDSLRGIIPKLEPSPEGTENAPGGEAAGNS